MIDIPDRTMGELIQIQVLEFQNLFSEEPDFQEETILKRYSRELMIEVVDTLCANYGNPIIRDLYDPSFCFFSKINATLKSKLNNRLLRYKLESGINKVCVFTLRTSLELLKLTFAIPPECFENQLLTPEFEYDIFRVILHINQRLFAFQRDATASLSQMLFFQSYAYNDFVNFNEQQIMSKQLAFVCQLVTFLDENHNGQIIRNAICKKYEIDSLKEYIMTLLGLYTLYRERKKQQKEGVCYLTCVDSNMRYLSKSIIDKKSIYINDIIPYGSTDRNNRTSNDDYRMFRSHPMIQVDDSKYVIYCWPLLCESLYNSLYFDMHEACPKNIDFFNLYNKEFVEHSLFHRMMWKCINCNVVLHFPKSGDVSQKGEKHNQPDFYLEDNEAAFIFECKSIKLNGCIKDQLDIQNLVDEIKLKLYKSNRNIDANRKVKNKCENVGVTQLCQYIDDLENNNVQWKNNIKQSDLYYPVLVLEDEKLAQCGMMGLLNELYREEVKDKKYQLKCKPLIVMSLRNMIFYAEIFKEMGFKRIFDDFLVKNTQNEIVNPDADFDWYMSQTFQVPESTTKQLREDVEKYILVRA